MVMLFYWHDLANTGSKPNRMLMTSCIFFLFILNWFFFSFEVFYLFFSLIIAYYLGFETCPDHWQSSSTFSCNPEIPYVVVSKLSVASSLFREVLHCYRKVKYQISYLIYIHFIKLWVLVNSKRKIALNPTNTETNVIFLGEVLSTTGKSKV